MSVLVVVKVLDIGFFTAFDRPFKPVDDSSYLGIGVETLRDAVGSSSADLAVAVAGVVVIAAAGATVALMRHAVWAPLDAALEEEAETVDLFVASHAQDVGAAAATIAFIFIFISFAPLVVSSCCHTPRYS